MIYINPYRFGSSFSNQYYAAFGGTNEYAIRSGFSPNGFTALALSFWFRSTQAGNNVYIVSFPNNSAGGGNGVDVRMDSGQLKFTLKTAAATTITSSIATSNDGNWHHVLAWWDGANMVLYIDNVQRATLAKTGTVTLASTEMNIGRLGSFGLYGIFDIDEVALFNTAPDSTARTAIYNGGTPGNLIDASIPTPTSWHRWDNALDDMTGTTGTIRDNIGSNHLTPFNTESADKVLY